MPLKWARPLIPAVSPFVKVTVSEKQQISWVTILLCRGKLLHMIKVQPMSPVILGPQGPLRTPLVPIDRGEYFYLSKSSIFA